ncbi:Lrp/AsnC family transcriptional regulator [Amycolatopsis minnesotensis]|uniref:Lrp/AsnC family transcriptional regulator n=2 Tax=Amycolatopsis minnesotensis TaxID=337894 RepID=A0ABN2R2Q7_9PSEU
MGNDHRFAGSGLPFATNSLGGTFSMERPLDDTDWRILAELQNDGRLSYSELGRRISLSSPSVAERVRRLEEAGVISAYRAEVDARRAGYPFVAFVQLQCAPNRCLLKTSASGDYPEVVEVHKLSGDHCTMLRVRAASLDHLEGIFERIGKHGEIRTSMVLSTQYEDRPVEPVADEYLRATPSEGWQKR